LVLGVGQQAERGVDLVGGGFQLEPPRERGAAPFALPKLDFDGCLFGPAIGTAAPIRFLSAILALSSHGLRI